LEEVLSYPQVFLLVVLLADHRVDDRLDDVLLGYDAIHILNKFVSFFDFIIFQIIDDQVESGLCDNVDQWR